MQSRIIHIAAALFALLALGAQPAHGQRADSGGRQVFRVCQDPNT